MANLRGHVIRPDSGSVPNLSDLVQAYRKQHPKYHELVDRITKTDSFIDQIVYRLYGLTEEEITIVEGVS